MGKTVSKTLHYLRLPRVRQIRHFMGILWVGEAELALLEVKIDGKHNQS